MTTVRSYTRILLLTAGLVSLFGMDRNVSAQESEQVIRDEYILSVIPPLREKAVQALEEASLQPLDIVDGSGTAVLVADIHDNEFNDVEDAEEKNSSSGCERLRKFTRLTRFEKAQTESNSIVRRFKCDENAVLTASMVPNDQLFGNLWAYQDYNRNPASSGIDLPQAWDLTTGSRNVIVSVIDTGIDYTHPDLAANIWTNPLEIAGNSIDDDGNGYIDDIHGINTITNSGNPMDDHGHGTHVSGTIGALGDNSIGVAGVNHQVSIVGAKFLSSSGSGSLFNAIKAIDYTTNLKLRGFNVIASNNSWGGGGYYYALENAIRRANDADVLFIAAAGNSAQNMDVTPSYPASYGIGNQISVAAMTNQDVLAGFSNYGSQTVDIAAPGYAISSTVLFHGYGNMSGTSMAAPQVAGAAALIAAYYPHYSMLDLKYAILTGARAKSSLNGRVIQSRYLNVRNALEVDVSQRDPSDFAKPTATPANTPTPTPAPTGTAAPTATPTPGYYDLTGRVTINGEGVPQAKVIVTLVRPNGAQEVISRFTSANGSYSFADILGPVAFTATVQAAGYNFNSVTGAITFDTTVNFAATANVYAITGTVLDNEKVPISGVVIESAFGTVTSNNLGRFGINVPYGARYTLKVRDGGNYISGAEPSRIVYGAVDHSIAVWPR